MTFLREQEFSKMSKLTPITSRNDLQTSKDRNIKIGKVFKIKTVTVDKFLTIKMSLFKCFHGKEFLNWHLDKNFNIIMSQ